MIIRKKITDSKVYLCLIIISSFALFSLIHDYKSDKNYFSARRKYISMSSSEPIRTIVDLDMHAQSYMPWKQDPECSFYTRFGKTGSLPMRALVSFPGSGNTLFRTMFESLSGVFTGFIDYEKSLYNAGFYGEKRDYRDGSTLLQKSHHVMSLNGKVPLNQRIELVDSFQGRALLLVRNPFDAVLSGIITMGNNGNSSASVDMETLVDGPFDMYAQKLIYSWLEIIEDWMTYGKEVFVIYYEDLVENPIQEMEGILEYLGITVQQKRMNCFKKHVNEIAEKFHRKKRPTFYPYTQQNKMIFRKVIEEADAILKRKLGVGGGLPLHKYLCYKDCTKYSPKITYHKKGDYEHWGPPQQNIPRIRLFDKFEQFT